MGKRPTVWSAERSGKNVRDDAVSVGRATNAAWSVATKAPLFLRKAKYVGVGKQKKRATMVRNGEVVPIPVKTNRCIKKVALKAMLSAAAQSAAATLQAEAEAMNTTVRGEAAVAAALPSLSKGAELALEHALVSYAQTIFDSAVRIKDSISKPKSDGSGEMQTLHQKVTANCMAAAAEIVNRKTFSSTGLATGLGSYNFRKQVVKKKRAKKDAAETPAEKETAADA